jgi:hypothetical protein
LPSATCAGSSVIATYAVDGKGSAVAHTFRFSP